MRYPETPDGRYFVVRGRLWRCTDPQLKESVRQQLVHELMDARRAVKAAKSADDADSMKAARAAVDRAKRALGERGPTWWDDDTDFNRCMAIDTPYAHWWAQLSKDEQHASARH